MTGKQIYAIAIINLHYMLQNYKTLFFLSI